MSNRRRTRNSNNNSGSNEAPSAADNDAVRAMRERSRAVAEREASRLARPDQPAAAKTLGHASKAVSAVSSTPFGHIMGARNNNSVAVVQEEWCGPFSVARQMIAAREEARRLREEQQAEADSDHIMGSKESHPLDEATRIALDKKRRLENPSMNWVSRRQRIGGDTSSGNTTNYYAARRRRFNQQNNLVGKGVGVPSLFTLCVNLLVNNFDNIDSLGMVDHSIRRALCERLVAEGKMTGAAFDTLAEVGVETLELVDCAQVTQEGMCDALKALLPSGLRAIILQHCGRCFGSQAVQVFKHLKPEEFELFAISLGGAYLLKDGDISELIGATYRTLSSIELTACPLLGNSFVHSLANNFSSSDSGANGCLLELSLENIPLTKEALLSLGASSDALRSLKSLRLKEMDAVDDEVVSIVLNSINGGLLEGIDLSNNVQLTDEILSSIRRCNVNGSLRALQLSGLKNLTAIGLEAFWTPIDDMPSPPMLRKLDLSQCCFEEVNDAVITLAAKAASFKRSVTDAGIGDDNPNPESLISEVGMQGLVHVNIGGSSVTDKSMEVLASTSSSSLEELDVSFAVNVSDKGLGYLVSKVSHQFTKLHVWGLAQITEDFLDGHDSQGLEIQGVWMKKSFGRSLR